MQFVSFFRLTAQQKVPYFNVLRQNCFISLFYCNACQHSLMHHCNSMQSVSLCGSLSHNPVHTNSVWLSLRRSSVQGTCSASDSTTYGALLWGQQTGSRSAVDGYTILGTLHTSGKNTFCYGNIGIWEWRHHWQFLFFLSYIYVMHKEKRLLGRSLVSVWVGVRSGAAVQEPDGLGQKCKILKTTGSNRSYEQI